MNDSENTVWTDPVPEPEAHGPVTPPEGHSIPTDDPELNQRPVESGANRLLRQLILDLESRGILPANSLDRLHGESMTLGWAMPEYVQVEPVASDPDHQLPFYVELAPAEEQLPGMVRGWEVDASGVRHNDQEKIWKRRRACRAILSEHHRVLVPV